MTGAAATVLSTMRDLRAGTITDDEYRATMRNLRESMPERDFMAAKLAAATANAR